MPVLAERESPRPLQEKISVSERPLAEEIIYLRHNYQREKLSHDWRYLNGTGFHVDTQVNMLFHSLATDDTPEERSEKINIWLDQTDQDVLGFNVEYLAQGLTFPIFYKALPEENRIVASLYGEKDIEDLVSGEERNGVVKKTIEEKIKPFLLSAPDGSVAIMSSPEGWSGLKDREGKPIIHQDSQTYVLKKQGEEIVGFTFRTDLSLEEHREVIRRIAGIELSQDASLTDYVASVALLDSEQTFAPEITQVAIAMKKIREEVSGKNYAYKDRSWNEIHSDIENRDNLWKFDAISKTRVNELRNFIINQWEGGRQEVEEALAVTILRISDALSGGAELYKNTRKAELERKFRQEYYVRDTMPDLRIGQAFRNYGENLEDMRSKPGCAGGGNSNSASNNLFSDSGLFASLTPRFVTADTLFDDEGFKCPKCSYKTKEPVGNTCPGCGLTKEEHAKQGNKVC